MSNQHFEHNIASYYHIYTITGEYTLVFLSEGGSANNEQITTFTLPGDKKFFLFNLFIIFVMHSVTDMWETRFVNTRKQQEEL